MELILLMAFKDLGSSECCEDVAFLESAIKVNWIFKNGKHQRTELIRNKILDSKQAT